MAGLLPYKEVFRGVDFTVQFINYSWRWRCEHCYGTPKETVIYPADSEDACRDNARRHCNMYHGTAMNRRV